MTSAARNALDARLAELRERAWAGDGEAQKQYLDIGARRADAARETLAEVDRLIAAGKWRPAK